MSREQLSNREAIYQNSWNVYHNPHKINSATYYTLLL